MNQETSAAVRPRYKKYLSPLAVWALSFGCSVGWGSFVMPGTTFLPIAGPVGTAIGISIGAVVMFIIGVNYHFLMNRYPDSGGIFAFTKNVFGYDHGFLSTWSMGLVYLAIIWANSTALPLIFRNIFGDLLQFGYLYSIAGYDVFIGEVLLSLCTILLFGAICMRGGKIASGLQIVMALVLIVGVVVAFSFVALDPNRTQSMFSPAFSPKNSPATGSFLIVFLAPWAFAGFESVSNSTEEFKFPVKRSLLIMTVSLITSAAAYIFLNFIGASAPSDGRTGLPVLNGVYNTMGNAGLAVLGVAAAAAIITGLMGNTIAASRLICSVAQDDMFRPKFGVLNRYGVPKYAVAFLILVSLPIPFLGRSATGWVVDINTISITIAYAYTSAAAFKVALKEHRKGIAATGFFGILISVFFLCYFLIPNKWLAAGLSSESYFMLLVWILAGFLAFYIVFRRDRAQRIGRSTVVWIVLLVLVFATSFIWIRKTTVTATDQAVTQISESEEISSLSEEDQQEHTAVITRNIDTVTGTIIRNIAFMFFIILAALFVIFNIYRIIQKRHLTAVKGKAVAEQSSNAKTTFLSNMSHDIRTPMNAIVGYVTLAKREQDLSPRAKDYLNKIEVSSGHLLSLINDVLEISRIESGKMELMPVPSDLCKITEEVKNLFSTQMHDKGLTYKVTCENITDPHILCDANRLNRVLLNLISNAYKFTPEGGSVTVTVKQTGHEDSNAKFRISVKDTGIGMSPEFAAKVFEAYERERTATVENIQGTGLGTAITKSIVDLMGGTIDLITEQGKGSEFIIHVQFPVDPAADDTASENAANSSTDRLFDGRRLLLAEDDASSADVAKTMFEELGFEVDIAVNGEDAVEMLAASAPGEYSAVIMDIEMPVKSGYDATRLIRSLKNQALAQIPVVALSAKAFSEDIAAARGAGMNAHIAKPIHPDTLKKTMTEILQK